MNEHQAREQEQALTELVDSQLDNPELCIYDQTPLDVIGSSNFRLVCICPKCHWVKTFDN